MNKNKPAVVQQHTRYVYTLPADRIRVQGLGMAMGCMAALRDYPQVLTNRDAIEAQARTGCLSLNVFFASPGWQLTNEFGQFCELLSEQYVRGYEKDGHVYLLCEADYRENKQETDRIGWAVVAALLVDECIRQLEETS